MDENVKKLLDKAAQQKEAHHAMNFAQAALNAAHALQVMAQVDKQVEKQVPQSQQQVNALR